MVEIWKDIENYEGLYQVSNFGRVRSLDRVVYQTNRWGGINHVHKKGTVLIPKLESGNRYYTVSLWKNGERSLKYVHRLVATAFLDNPFNLKEVNHIDENKINNNTSNLEWCDRQYNATYGSLKNHFKGERNPSVKLTESDVRIIKSLISKGLSDYEIASKFNVTKSNINYIRLGKTWRWVI